MLKSSLARTAALALVLSSAAFASSYAAPTDPTAVSGPPNSTVTFDSNGNVISATPDTSMSTPPAGMYQQQPGMQQPMMRHHHQQPAPQADATPQSAPQAAPMPSHEHGPAAMKEHVEERIKSLHAKLGITKDQEPEWSNVAQAMRDSEANVSDLIQERHNNAGNMNAVDDLDSYQAIAQAHADGLKKVNDAFKTLYSSMSPEQQKNADKVFSGYEGHDGGHGPRHHHHKKPLNNGQGKRLP